MDLSVVIPVYNSEATLRPLVARLLPVLNGMGLSYEILFVDDGSSDGSWKVLSELRSVSPEQIVTIQLMRNFGQHNALMCGFRHAQGRFVVTLDDDLQNPPEEIRRLLDAIQTTGLDLVYGCPELKQQRGLRAVASWLVNRLFFRIVFNSPARVGSFRILRRELLEAVFSYNLNFTYVDGLFAWNTQRIGQAAVEHHPRATGQSGYSLSKLVVLALNLFTNFSLIPLQVVSLIGLCTAGMGMLLGSFFVIQYFLANIVVPGYASIITSVLLLGGLQLLSLGIMGEYLGRLHLNVNRKPQYVIRDAIPCDNSQPMAKPVDLHGDGLASNELVFGPEAMTTQESFR